MLLLTNLKKNQFFVTDAQWCHGSLWQTLPQVLKILPDQDRVEFSFLSCKDRFPLLLAWRLRRDRFQESTRFSCLACGRCELRCLQWQAWRHAPYEGFRLHLAEGGQ